MTPAKRKVKYFINMAHEDEDTVTMSELRYDYAHFCNYAYMGTPCSFPEFVKQHIRRGLLVPVFA